MEPTRTQRAAALENWANRVEPGGLVEADTAVLRTIADSAQPRSATPRRGDELRTARAKRAGR